MNNKETEEVLKELYEVRPERLNDKAKRLYDAIMTIADERDEYKKELEIKNKIIDRMVVTFIDDRRNKEDVIEYFTKLVI